MGHCWQGYRVFGLWQQPIAFSLTPVEHAVNNIAMEMWKGGVITQQHLLIIEILCHLRVLVLKCCIL